MSNRSDRKLERPPRQCTFCERNANSPEHLWSDWMAKHFERRPHDFALEIRQRFHPDPQAEPIVAKLHGHVVTRTHKVVCKTCNNGWMSDLETPAKLSLEPMLLGQSLALDVSLQQCLSRWVVLKLMVFERRDDSKPVFTREEALRFKADRTIPENLSIDLFHTIDDRLRSVIHRESAAIPPVVDPLPDLIVTNVQAVTFGVGRVLIYARHAQLSELGFKEFSPNIASRLWPAPDETVIWPPSIALSFDDVQHINGSMGRFLAKMTPV